MQVRLLCCCYSSCYHGNPCLGAGEVATPGAVARQPADCRSQGAGRGDHYRLEREEEEEEGGGGGGGSGERGEEGRRRREEEVMVREEEGRRWKRKERRVLPPSPPSSSYSSLLSPPLSSPSLLPLLPPPPSSLLLPPPLPSPAPSSDQLITQVTRWMSRAVERSTTSSGSKRLLRMRWAH